MPIYNAESTLDEALDCLAAQDYNGRWEVLLVDNLSTDHSAAICETWLDRLPQARLIKATDTQGVSHARNVGAAAARGDFVAVCDADDRSTPGWLKAISEAATFGDMVAGAYRTRIPLNDAVGYPVADSADLEPLGCKFGYLPYAPGGSMGAWKCVIDAIGGWDESIRLGADDTDFGWRAQEAGFSLVAAPGALIDYRLRPGLRSLAHQRYHYGRGDSLLADRYTRRLADEHVRVSVSATMMYCGKLALSTIARRTPLPLAIRYGAYRLGRLVGAWTYGRHLRL